MGINLSMAAARAGGLRWPAAIAVATALAAGLVVWGPSTGAAVADQDAPAPAAPAAVVGAADEVAPGSAAAAVDYFLKIDGIEGESTAPGFEGTIEIESWSWGATQSSGSASGGGGGAGKVSLQDFHFSVKSGKASPKLFLSCATGQHIKRAVLFVRKQGSDSEPYLTVTMEDLLVSSFQVGGSSGDARPTEQVSLNFTKIEYKVGAARASWDLKKNK